ncbi:MAG: hypothetical protein OXG04_27910 [Acidobacteria bacterium]|nr:hypothetical protein [Acidobacteriota bacterium]
MEVSRCRTCPRPHGSRWPAPSPCRSAIDAATGDFTSPAPQFMLGGVENQHLYHNSTLALDCDTGETAPPAT